eukprot:CAMPEP_0183729080 /NCGR_PEP_ID=MMETSP0737-20130205/29671_1 /TAXON_ID=385413 /ORGANISM="Thalassiosira miniscula, Strain CCMP1093" /LENGTH=291 /DNA_ID=CAMNT_0025961185 /DNA_START=4 /DNA_END=879 /DNA_ORIENTATION=-
MAKIGRNIIGTVLGLALRSPQSSYAFTAPAASIFPLNSRSMASSSSSQLDMVRNRGLERREEGATPLPGGMTLYVKPAEDGKSVGDCPFAHFVRMVLSEKGLEYDLLPSTPENKPQWLLDDYGGKMPALRHRKECYVDSEVIAQYLDFFFKDPELSVGGAATEAASNAMDGFFPAMAKFTKHSPNGDEEDQAKQAVLEEKLANLEEHLSDESRTGPYLVGDGTQFTLLDCSMAPKLYAMDVCLREIKDNAVDMGKYPNVRKYMDALFDRPSFKSTVEYGPETVVWGWTSYH